jgi:hypothetical protein
MTAPHKRLKHLQAGFEQGRRLRKFVIHLSSTRNNVISKISQSRAVCAGFRTTVSPLVERVNRLISEEPSSVCAPSEETRVIATLVLVPGHLATGDMVNDCTGCASDWPPTCATAAQSLLWIVRTKLGMQNTKRVTFAKS